MVGFDVSASTESENEGLPLTQLPAATSSPMVLSTVTADRRAATLPANKCVIYGFYISHILSSDDLLERKDITFFTKLICLIKTICLPNG